MGTVETSGIINKSHRDCRHSSSIGKYPASILYKSISGRYRPFSYPDGPIKARYIFIKNAYWVHSSTAVEYHRYCRDCTNQWYY